VKLLDEVTDFEIHLPRFDTEDDVFSRGRAALEWLTAKYAARGRSSRFCLYGYSMGGVVVRTVLAMLEKEKPFPPAAVRCVVSLDAPHTGAYIPLGLQYTFEWAEGRGFLSAEQRKRLATRFRSKAAKQLLGYYLHWNPVAVMGKWVPVGAPASPRERNTPLRGGLRAVRKPLLPLAPPGKKRGKKRTLTYAAKPHPERTRLLGYLGSVEPPGRWCGDAVKLGIANGAAGQPHYRQPRNPLLAIVYHAFVWGGELLVFGEPGDSRVILDTTNNVERYFDLPKVRIRLATATPQWVRGPGSLDRSVNTELAHAITREIRRRVRNSCKKAPGPETCFVQENMTFIPTVSALDVRVQDPFWLERRRKEEIVKQCPFDTVFIAPENESHAIWTDKTSTLIEVVATVMRALDSRRRVRPR
jgi:hypothetical protein